MISRQVVARVIVEFSQAGDDRDLIMSVHPQARKITRDLVDHCRSLIVFDHGICALRFECPRIERH
jgi:hypothetical protein